MNYMIIFTWIYLTIETYTNAGKMIEILRDKRKKEAWPTAAFYLALWIMAIIGLAAYQLKK